MKPLISVIITFHNQEKFVDDCLTSFRVQDTDLPFEIIAIDDASHDGTATAIEQYNRKAKTRQASYFKVDFRNANKARNFGMDQAQGDFICFFDGDDYVYPEYLRRLHQALVENPEAGLSYARFKFELAGLDKMKIATCNSFEWSPSWLKYRPIVNTPTMIRREWLTGVRWNEELRSHQDYEFNLQLAAKGITGVHVRDELWFYRWHSTGVWASGQGLHDHPARKLIKEKYGVGKPAPITFVSLISRMRYLDKYFEAVEKVRMPREDMHWFIFIDGKDEDLVKAVKARAENQKFLSTRIYVSNERTLVNSIDFYQRGMRIARNLKAIINNVKIPVENGGSDFIFMLEDDTFAPPDAFEKLWGRMQTNNKLAYIQGVEVSRAPTHHLGAAWLSEVDGEIVDRINFAPRFEGYQKLNAGGWYCWIGRIRAIKNWKPRCIAQNQRTIGPDNLMVYDLVKHGWDAEMDWTVVCGHHSNEVGKVLYLADAKGYHFKYVKKSGIWRRLTEEIK